MLEAIKGQLQLLDDGFSQKIGKLRLCLQGAGRKGWWWWWWWRRRRSRGLY
jgi:hypothetical protein